MTKKIVWFIVSCLMVLTLVLASCESDTDTGGTSTLNAQRQSDCQIQNRIWPPCSCSIHPVSPSKQRSKIKNKQQ